MTHKDARVSAKLQKHHYIPKFYLKRWAGSDRRVEEFSRPFTEVISRRRFPDACGYVRGLYTIPGLPPREGDWFEQRFLQIADNLAAVGIDMILSGRMGELSNELRSACSRFIVSLLLRNPQGVERTLRSFGERVDIVELKRRVVRELERQNVIDQFSAHEVDDLVLKSVTNAGLSALGRSIDSERIGNFLHGMRWGVVKAATSHPFDFLTSDRPVIMTNGLDVAHAHVVLPLSPRAALVLARDRATEQMIQATFQRGWFTRALNDRVARQARQFVYASDVRQSSFIAKRLGEMDWASPWEPGLRGGNR